jgi:hypothetical protein
MALGKVAIAIIDNEDIAALRPGFLRHFWIPQCPGLLEVGSLQYFLRTQLPNWVCPKLDQSSDYVEGTVCPKTSSATTPQTVDPARM